MTTIQIKDNMMMTGKVRTITYRAGTKEILRTSEWSHNAIVAGTTDGGYGLYLIIKHLNGDVATSLQITQAKIGSGTGATTDVMTDLVTPITSNILIAASTLTAKTIFFEFFIANDELPTGTYTEFGLFNATQLFSRVLFAPAYDKGDNEDTKVEYLLTLTN